MNDIVPGKYSKEIEATTECIIDIAERQNIPVADVFDRAVKNTSGYNMRDPAVALWRSIKRSFQRAPKF